MTLLDDDNHVLRSLDRYVLERQRKDEEARRNVERLARWRERYRRWVADSERRECP